MAEIEVHVSDISGARGALGKLVVHQHPQYADRHLPVELEALPEEVEPLRQARLVHMEWIPPGSSQGQHLHVPASELRNAGPDADQFDVAMRRAASTRQGSTAIPQASRAAGQWAARQRVDYTSLEHAGMPHIGRVAAAEQAVVRNNLEAVNERLHAAGVRQIDPEDPVMATRYGLAPSALDPTEPWPPADA